MCVSNEVARITEPDIFHDGFYSRGGVLADVWSVTSGSASLFSEVDLEVETTPMELVYVGTSLDSLKLRNSTNNANFAIIARFFGREDLQISVRGRRQDANNFIALNINFSTNIASLSKTVSGVETILDQVEHTFSYEEIKYYSADLWMFENILYGKINKSLILFAVDSTFMTEPGFSIFIPEINLLNPAKLDKVAVHELIEQESPQLEDDPSNLIVQFRKNMEITVEQPDEFNWDTYRKAYKMWSMHKDMWYKDSTWTRLGYPIEPPRTETWFV